MSSPSRAGLCDSCAHQKLIRTTRGSEFSMCLRSRDEPERYPKYPQLPVRRCAGYAPREHPGRVTALPEDPS